ncbi:hypothetical protein Ddye_016652 [Dipteronia dyeriana]|uniref:Reverse transcriptase zinc-binding domain-containing protein n=1 Tax=Dipteronia dyeriana TaxID=168575 RepID=A0AAD9U7W3_9ROSI|nr:hypothetical protein Ddye_016652 [Dipteronia dyeriana]
MESLRTPHPLVSCYKIVWFPQNIPRMGFVLWLAIKGRLSTLDRVQRYDPQVVTTCVLCNSQAETHAHLFFECFYSKAIWTQLLNKCGCLGIHLSWNDLIDWVSVHWKRSSPSVVTKNFILRLPSILFGESEIVIFLKALESLVERLPRSLQILFVAGSLLSS